MNITEAEAFFKASDGNRFLMYREDTDKYAQYSHMNILPDTEETWRQELMQICFTQLSTLSKDTWCIHSRIIGILHATTTKIRENCSRLLTAMQDFQNLDKQQKILITENMAGRDSRHKSGGCYLICSRTALGKEMQKIMTVLTDFTCDLQDNTAETGWQDMGRRYADAVKAYRAAYRRFRIYQLFKKDCAR